MIGLPRITAKCSVRDLTTGKQGNQCLRQRVLRHFTFLVANNLLREDFHFTGDTQCLPLYRYTPDGQRVSNITKWGMRINVPTGRWGTTHRDESITAEDIFAYTYAVLHDPEYRETYAVDLLREFPRLPFHDDFAAWTVAWAASCWTCTSASSPLTCTEPGAVEASGDRPRQGDPVLRADKERGAIVLDGKTTLTGVPAEAWEYRLGSRSALEWVLDQYKGKEAPRPDHPGTVQHLPLRRPQGAGHRPPPARLHRQRPDGGNCSGDGGLISFLGVIGVPAP